MFGSGVGPAFGSCLRIIFSRSALTTSFSSSGKRETASNCSLRSSDGERSSSSKMSASAETCRAIGRLRITSNVGCDTPPS